MKKFLAICIFLFFSVVFTLRYFKEVYIKSLDTSYIAFANDESIFINNDGQYEKTYLKGVNINNVLPGSLHEDVGAKEEDYLRWFKYIHEMNSNVLRVQTLMPSNFYEALEVFNKDKENPLYLVQGIEFDLVALEDGADMQGSEIEEVLLQDIKNTVNAMHGNPFGNMPEDLASIYKTDISDYLIAYTIGVEFESNDIIYSHIMNDDKSYTGKYVGTKKNASSVESFLARMSDFLVNYEVTEYKRMTPINFIATAYSMIETIDSKTGFSLSHFGELTKTKHYIDVENILPTDEYKSGIFVSYNIYPSIGLLKEYVDDISSILQKLNEYHSVPVLISEYGIPASRLVADYNTAESKGGIDEVEQGNMLADISSQIYQSNCAGGIVYGFQDDWNISSWNTKEKIVLDKNPYWRNVQTYGQSYGILSFDPLIDGKAYYPDNDISEWADDEVLSSNDTVDLYVKASEEYLHFYIDLKGRILSFYDEFYIDIDITPNSGGKISRAHNLVFEMPVDFLVQITDEENSKILVHEYYSTNTFKKLEEQIRSRPDEQYVAKHRGKFIPIEEYTAPKVYVADGDYFMEEKFYETGKLTHGNANPESVDFNSLTDFNMGDGYIEVRIPYGVLNFMDPSSGLIQDDFFEEFQIKPLKIDSIYVGLTLLRDGEVATRLSSKEYKLEGWSEPTYKERLKKSYYILKEEFKKR